MIKLLQTKKTTLAYGISDSATTMRLNNLLKLDGTSVSASDIGDILYGTFDPGTSREEIFYIVGSNVTVNSDGTVDITGVVRGLEEVYPYSTGGFATDHPAGGVVIFGNNPQLYASLIGFLANNEVLSGYWEAPDPITAQGLVTRDWILALINGGPISVNSILVPGTCGENVSAGNLLYLKSSDGKWYKTAGTDTSTIDNVQLAIAQGAGTSGGAISGGVLIKGVDTNNTGTAGGYAYASDTAGAVATSAGTYERRIGQFIISSGGLYFDPQYYLTTTPTRGEKSALAGSQGVLGSSNKFITQDNVLDSNTDQSQTTQNATVEAGEANATAKKNKIAQSFIPAKTKIRGVKLYKSADTGSFTGTVTISLQADSSGSPSGSALATVTISNAEYLALLTGAFEALFSSEYTSLVVGDLYWIVIQTSTSDNSNHPNLGTNSAGGYASGSVKYNNTTDGWVAIATIDLYFQTLEGIDSQIVKTESGKINTAIVPTFSAMGVNTGHNDNEATETITITHNLGFKPTKIKIKAIAQVYNSNNPTDTIPREIAVSEGEYLNGNYACTYYFIGGDIGGDTADHTNSSTAAVAIIKGKKIGTGTQTATIANITLTTFDIVWTKSGTIGAGNSIKTLWEASLV